MGSNEKDKINDQLNDESDNIEGFTRVCQISDLQTSKMMKMSVRGREIALFYHQDNVYALDKHCYHAGGPLENGDIEEITGQACVVCPYHKHRISLETGESLVYKSDWKKPQLPGQWCSKGRMQRTHHVKVVKDVIYVALSDLSSPQESDYFYE